MITDITWLSFFFCQSSYQQIDGNNEHGRLRMKKAFGKTRLCRVIIGTTLLFFMIR